MTEKTMSQKFAVIHVWPRTSSATIMPDYFETCVAAEQSAKDYAAAAASEPGHKYFVASLPMAVEPASSDEDIASDDLIERARALHCTDEINVDFGAKISAADEGTWVQGWLWVPDEEA